MKVEDKQETQSWNSGPYWWWYAYPRNTYTRNYEEGTLIVDLVDARTNKLVWQGWAVGEINYASDRYKEELARKVAQIFAEFPARIPVPNT
ncbi:MAG: DUF4136 domain-containing protein [Bacteroidia bacterium]|nr:DUF4136 domain-containing protein [Bacteroidia bacterium]